MHRLAPIVCVALAASSAFAQDRSLPDRVDDAIARGVDHLFKSRVYVENGHWESDGGGEQFGGRTALATYALLASGVSHNDPRLRKPIEFLRQAEIGGYYALGLRPQVWMYLPRTVDNRAYVERDFRLLVKGIEKDRSKEDFGLFDYTLQDRVRIDLSVSQYGTLGIWACVQLGAESPEGDVQGNRFNFWRLIDTRWKSLQDPTTGGWAYSGTGQPSGTMTAAGVSTLFITQDYLGTPGDRLDAWSMPKEIERGIAFLDADFPKLIGDGEYRFRHYALYGIERVGTASGYKWIGSRDWYAEGADYLGRTQRADGGWSGDSGDDVTTAFSLLFLARGREPVMMNKLQFDRQNVGGTTQPAGWNGRWRDVANVARFLGREGERGLNWQVLDLNRATIRDLHDAPVAYLSAPRRPPLRLPPESVDKLRAYVESGGIVVLNGDATRGERPATTRAGATAAPEAPPLFTAMFPYATYRALPADHPILRGQQFRGANWKQSPAVFELTNGARTLALYFADDAGLAWQLNNLRTTREKFELAANVYQYAVDKEHARVKGRTHYVEPDAPTTRAIERSVRVARLKFAGNWDPEPGGWTRLQTLAKQGGLGVGVETVDLTSGGKLNGFAVAHLTGVGPARLSQSAVEELVRFLADGGTLIVDAAGGDATFGEGVAKALAPIAPAFSLTARPVAPEDPLLAGDRPIAFRYRTFAVATLGPITTPRLRVSRTGRGVVVFSPEDLSVGLVGQPVDGIRGYTPEVATEIVMRLLRGAAK